MFLLEQYTSKIGRINKELPKPKREFKAKNDKEYEFEAIINDTIYNKEANNQILGSYYLVLYKSYPEIETL